VLLTLSLKGHAAPPVQFDYSRLSGFPDSGVYVIEAVGLDRYKIGYTNDIKTRMSALQTGCPVPIDVVCVLPCGADTEKWLHRRFEDYRVQGEWFDLPDSAIQYLLYVSQMEELPEKTIETVS